MRRQPRVGRYLSYGLIDPRTQVLRYIGKTHLRREKRLARHLEAAEEGAAAPVSRWISELMGLDLEPEIFVLRRVDALADWRIAEREEILKWRAWSSAQLPYEHPPQTPKSKSTHIAAVNLLNVRDGG